MRDVSIHRFWWMDICRGSWDQSPADTQGQLCGNPRILGQDRKAEKGSLITAPGAWNVRSPQALQGPGFLVTAVCPSTAPSLNTMVPSTVFKQWFPNWTAR